MRKNDIFKNFLDTVKDCLIAEYDSIPPIEELRKMYTFSERHEKKMKKLFDKAFSTQENSSDK